MQKMLLFFFLFLFNHYLHAQTSAPENSRSRLIEGMVSLRDDVMRNPETDLLGLQEFLQLYGSDCNGYAWFFDSWFNDVAYNYWYANSKAQINPTDSIQLTHQLQHEYSWKNRYLIDLIFQGILLNKLPYPIAKNGRLFDEFDAYNLHDGMKIAEIGDGTGTISLLIGASYKNTALYINEVDSMLVKLLKDRVKDAKCLNNNDLISVVQGQENSAGLEGKDLDLIFIREAYHHFSDKKQMIKSIKKSLRPGGVVCVYERVLKFYSEDHSCSMHVYRSNIVRPFKRAGFKLIEEKTIGQKLFLKFQII
ncbi:MAG: class I SAM-dependent methyltransferase [Bacteroidota bacterium]